VALRVPSTSSRMERSALVRGLVGDFALMTVAVERVLVAEPVRWCVFVLRLGDAMVGVVTFDDCDGLLPSDWFVDVVREWAGPDDLRCKFVSL
jgi:hypothetical protein